MSEKFLTALQVAERYGRPVNWIYTCKELQECKVKIGKYIFFRESDLLALEEKRSKSPRGFDLKQSKEIVIRQTEESKANTDARKRLKMDIL